MVSSVFDKMNGVLFHPSEAFGEDIRNETLTDTLLYLLILVVIFTVLASVLILVGVSAYAGFVTGIAAGGLSAIALIPLLFFAGLAGIIIFAAYLHIWVCLAGGREGIITTWKTVVYASTPSLLLGWIPVIGALMWLWSLVLTILGIRDLHQISLVRAFLAVFIGYLVLVFLGIAVVGSMFASILTVS